MSGSSSSTTTGSAQSSPTGSTGSQERNPREVAQAGPQVIEPAVQVGKTLSVTSGVGGLALPLALLVVLLGGATASAVWLLRRRSARV
jgi:hypothetical protein